jgi:hypothetical protein
VLALVLAASSETFVVAAEPDPAGAEFFEKKIRPLLVEKCHKCHSTQAKKQKGGLLLDSRAGLLKGGDSGPALVPGQPEKSLLIEAVRYQNGQLQMPPSSKLPDSAVALLQEWIKRGAPFPGPNEVGESKAAVSLADGRKFWSFQPPRVAALPEIQNKSWPRRRLDAFLLAELEKRNLSPSPYASRKPLIRRATYDLIGLPPTPEEVEAFVQDAAPDAYARLIERLLASPAYGERWGRFWLDLSRYCDVAESWTESKGQPWLYRDWVIQALNDDLPYDRFVQWQLAADLLSDTTPRDQAALGFLGLSPTYWKELKLDPVVIQTVVAEEWEERIQAVTGTFLGLTVACARCHDHKFDPITQHDYYALAGVLGSNRLADRLLAPINFRSLLGAFHLPTLARTSALDVVFVLRQSQIENEKSKILLAPGLDEASLYVLPDGPHRTKLEYRAGVAQNVALQIRGNPGNPGPVVPRRFLAVLSAEPPRLFTQGSGRLELARALVNEGAPLTARVMVNRIWKHHFGAGLVETTSDFGAQGTRPSHPELLDDLAARFQQNGWSLKWLHREIMLSAAYQQSSAHDDKKHAVDTANRWLWRMNRRRLEIEAWRDAMLAASGTLRWEQGGPPLELGDPHNRRRTLYGMVKRRELHDMLRLHDFPDPATHSPGRIPTTTPLQQLFVLNSPFLQQQAAALVERLKREAPLGVEDRVRRAYLLLYGRPATDMQVQWATEFLQPESDGLWWQYAQVLLGSNEFLFVD